MIARKEYQLVGRTLRMELGRIGTIVDRGTRINVMTPTVTSVITLQIAGGGSYGCRLVLLKKLLASGEWSFL